MLTNHHILARLFVLGFSSLLVGSCGPSDNLQAAVEPANGGSGNAAGTAGASGSGVSGTGGDSGSGGTPLGPCDGADDGLHCGDEKVCVKEACVDSVCGDGVTDSRTETCDDEKNGDDEDGCTDACALGCEKSQDCDDGDQCNGQETCASSNVCELGETALEDATACGVEDDRICVDEVCTKSECGDELIDPRTETCDDGKTGGDADGCTDLCQLTCADDVDCDDGNACNGVESCDVDAHQCANGDTQDDGVPCGTAEGYICLSASCAESRCGDLFIDFAASENCDDGDQVSGNGCSDACKKEDGYACSGTGPGSCSPICGDSKQVDSEGCDDGNDVSDDGCSATCGVEDGYACVGTGPGSCSPICGDSKIIAPEKCDDGDEASDNGCSATCEIEDGYQCSSAGPGSCTPICGDGKRVGSEGCDDAGTAANDGCSATCAVEDGYACVGIGPGSCAPICGDSKIITPEKCDDGGASPNDGCSDTCRIEDGYACSGTGPGSCTEICGDSKRVGGEGCDDGDTASANGCSATCAVEDGYACVGIGPGSCTPICGDLKTVGGEQCDDGKDGDDHDGCKDDCTYTCSLNTHCIDDDACTVDECDPASHTCDHTLWDVDGDGFAPVGLNCKNDAQEGDCHDGNGDVKPGQTTYFATPYDAAGGGKSWDYNCDAKESHRWGPCTICLVCQDGWTTVEPGCGNSASWTDKSGFSVPCVVESTKNRTQECR